MRIRLDRLDPLATRLPFGWPAVNAATMSLWEPVPVAVDKHGETIALSLIEKNLLLGGEPGGGKSTILGLLTAAGALDVEVRLHLFDGKQVELAAWSRLAATVVGPDPQAAAQALAGLRSVKDERYGDLLRLGRRKITRGDGLPLHLVVIDELALFVNTGDRKLDGEISNHLRDLVSRGRAAGIIVLAATQKPSSDVIPTHIRDLFSMRWALRCATPQASDTVLGQGWATAGYSASTVDAGQRGVGFLLHEGDTPTRCCGFHLSDADLAAIAERAAQLPRSNHDEDSVGGNDADDESDEQAPS